MIVAVEDGGAAHNRHEDDIGGDVLVLESVARLSPSLTQWLHCWFTSHNWIVVGAGPALINAEHASCERDQRHDHLPWMRRTKLAMSTKQASRFHHVNDLSVESVNEKSSRELASISRRVRLDYADGEVTS